MAIILVPLEGGRNKPLSLSETATELGKCREFGTYLSEGEQLQDCASMALDEAREVGLDIEPQSDRDAPIFTIGLLVRDRALAASMSSHFRGLIDRELLRLLPMA